MLRRYSYIHGIPMQSLMSLKAGQNRLGKSSVENIRRSNAKSLHSSNY